MQKEKKKGGRPRKSEEEKLVQVTCHFKQESIDILKKEFENMQVSSAIRMIVDNYLKTKKKDNP